MNHKAFCAFYIAFLVLVLSLSSATSRPLSVEDGKVPQGSLPYGPLHKEPICKKYILGKCIATKKPPIALKPCRSLTQCHKMEP